MFERALPEKTDALLNKISPVIAEGNFYLAGGSGLALQIGHRISEDLDFFKESFFTPGILLAKLRETAEKVEEIIIERDTLVVILDGVRLSFFKYDVPLVYPPIILRGVRVADWRDISAEKFKTLAQRGSKKDFYDLYAIIHFKRVSIEELVGIMKRRFASSGLNFYHVLKSLAYFEDAEKEPEPSLIKNEYSWDEVKNYFVENIREFEKWVISSSP